MIYNSITNIKICSESVFQMMNGNVSLLYYAHVPSIIISFLMGLFVLIKSKKSIEAKIFFVFSLTFSFWALLNLVAWISSDSRIIMFAWSLLGILSVLFYLLSLYFVYVFLDKKDISFVKKLIFGLLITPIIFFTPTTINLKGFDLGYCAAIDNLFFGYVYIPQIISSLWIIFLVIHRWKKAPNDLRRQIALLAFGVIFFLLTFFSFGYIADNYEIYKLEIFGLFAQLLFLGVLAYMIVKFKAFEIKLLGAQALVVTLFIIIGSQFFFIKSFINQVLTGITLLLLIVFGWALIRSVKKEVQQREELEIANMEIEKRNVEILDRNDRLKAANKEITKRKNQLQRISDFLAIANDKLKKLDTAKTDFISMASHQLRTPPTPIKGYSSMLLEGSYGALNEEQKKAIENISAANNQQITFVEDLLAVSRIESGSMKFVFEKCQIGDLCQDVINNLILKARDKNLYLDYSAPATPLPEIAIDGSKMREVISNLVDNAVKYTQRGGVTILTELCQKKEQNCLSKAHLRVTVSDTGIGIPSQELPYLFQKFSRGKDITRLNTGGTGLGLYVAKMITLANGGTIWIESPGAGRGSKFIIELPLEQTQETIERNG